VSEIAGELIEQRLKRFVDVCRCRGLKVTHQRLEIFRQLASTDAHPTAEEIFNRVRVQLPRVSLDTVYRTLATMQEYGLIARVEALDDRGRFDANLERHHHFVCTECKGVSDFYWPSLDVIKLPREAKKLGEVRQICAELRGICTSCQSQPG
jgi:Fur family peroxide stress response transcriptional regulator